MFILQIATLKNVQFTLNSIHEQFGFYRPQFNTINRQTHYTISIRFVKSFSVGCTTCIYSQSIVKIPNGLNGSLYTLYISIAASFKLVILKCCYCIFNFLIFLLLLMIRSSLYQNVTINYKLHNCVKSDISFLDYCIFFLFDWLSVYNIKSKPVLICTHSFTSISFVYFSTTSVSMRRQEYFYVFLSKFMM